MTVRFLLDEHITPRLKAAVLRLDSRVEVVLVGEPGAPALGTLDPDLLQFTEQAQHILVTQDYQTMLTHAAAHLAQASTTQGSR